MAHSRLLEFIVKVVDQASDQLEKIKGGSEGVGESLVAMAGTLTLAGMAIDKATRFISGEFDEWQEYVFTVENLAEAFGMTYEETEQLIYISDLYGVSSDALFSTLNKLNREGLGLGITGLSNLRDEFLKIEDPAERAAYLFGMAGEQGQKVLAPLLAMTELEWRALMEGIEGLGLVDAEMAENARALEEATAGIAREWMELKILLADWAAPGVTNLLTVISDLLGGNVVDSVIGAPSGYERMTGTSLPGGMMPEDYRRQNTEADRWQAVADALENLPGDIKDAVERHD